MKYIIIQDSRLNKGMYIALSDKTKQRSGWWTSVLENALIFDNKESASEVASKLQYNSPKVIPYNEAEKLVSPIVSIKYSYEIKPRKKNIFEMSDSEYKEWLGYSDAIEYGGGMFT